MGTAKTRQLDGTEIGVTPFVSGLINGKGRRYDASGNAMKSYIPVEEIEIVKKGTYRFRLISAAMMYPFRFSIDGHELHVFATDGNLIKTTTVDALIINSGERFDFYIETSAPVTNYWIRAETLETETILGTPISPGIVRGILRYRSADDMEPTSTRQTCSDNDRCLVMNCPFRYYPETAKTDCLSWSEVKAPKRRAAPAISNKYTFQEKFINFHFSGDTSLRSSVNGRRFIPPSTPPMILPGGDEKDYMTKCNDTECAQRHCDCTHYITLPSDAIVQIVLYNIRVGEGLSGTSHPVHFHGHHFHVLKSGFGTYDTTTGRFLDDTTDISCGDDIPRCNSGSWSNSSWSGDDIPGLNLVDPPIKDTVIVPVGGYVVIRYKTDNPGWWFVHCHIEIHQVEGMALMIKEGEEKQMTKPPKDFKTCGNFQWSREEFKEIISMGSKPSLNTLVFCLAVYIAFNAVTAI
uniref:Laccase-like n=1 Tax=Saccoglossus kowalevskii TaxID=10224 RepID=A0ABM0LWW7_SACKO|nr:PREDICTED: laccase-like [Saccoglossus kowalevskii]